MTDPNYAHYILVIDRSGSMWNIALDAQGGINQFVRDQAVLPGKGTISLYQFDAIHDKVLDFADIKTAPEYTLTPRGSTALLDAVGFAVTQEGEKLAAMPEDQRPRKVIMLIATDGAENQSREYNLAQVKKLLTWQQEEYCWTVSYIGANVDAFANAASMGISLNSTIDYAATARGTAGAYAAASRGSVAVASGQSIDIRYTDAERDAAADKGNIPA